MKKVIAETVDPKKHWIYENCQFSFTDENGVVYIYEYGNANKPDWHAMTVTIIPPKVTDNA